MKQELANKLETAQTSYNAVQKTLTEIGKMLNQPSGEIGNIMHSPSGFIEDDWDESAKPKFLNK